LSHGTDAETDTDTGTDGGAGGAAYDFACENSDSDGHPQQRASEPSAATGGSHIPEPGHAVSNAAHELGINHTAAVALEAICRCVICSAQSTVRGG
jgi:hypothetical protein